jgi:hypothetical protein
MEKSQGEIRKELGELEQERQRLLDESTSKPIEAPGSGSLRRTLIIISERLKRIKDLERRIEGLKARLG